MLTEIEHLNAIMIDHCRTYLFMSLFHQGNLGVARFSDFDVYALLQFSEVCFSSLLTYDRPDAVCTVVRAVKGVVFAVSQMLTV